MAFSVGTAKAGVPQKTIRMSILPANEFMKRIQPDLTLRHHRKTHAGILRISRPILNYSSPLALFSQLLDLAPDQISFQHAQVLNEQDAVQVINLMAESSRQ
jgi:hypothetical protein